LVTGRRPVLMVHLHPCTQVFSERTCQSNAPRRDTKCADTSANAAK
jgi:hypothetical protein